MVSGGSLLFSRLLNELIFIFFQIKQFNFHQSQPQPTVLIQRSCGSIEPGESDLICLKTALKEYWYNTNTTWCGISTKCADFLFALVKHVLQKKVLFQPNNPFCGFTF